MVLFAVVWLLKATRHTRSYAAPAAWRAGAHWLASQAGRAASPSRVASRRWRASPGSAFFANAENVRGRILDAGLREGVHAVILDAETVPFVDVTAARMLVAAHDELHTHGIRLVLARAVGQVRDVLGCITQEQDLTASYPMIDAAVDALRGAQTSRPRADGATPD